MPRIKSFGKKKFTGNIHTRPKTPIENNDLGITMETTEDLENQSNLSPVTNESSSKKKLKYLGMVGSKCDYVKSEMGEGNVIIDLEILSAQICSFVSCRSCSAVGTVNIFEDTTNRQGIVSNLVLICSACTNKSSFMSSKRTESKHFENNLRLVYGLRSIGKGQVAAETLCSVLNLPPPPSRFYQYNKRLVESLEIVCNESMTNAKREAIANEENSDITVAMDGTWQKRGHKSLNGVVTATSLDIGKVIDIECLSKYCPTCKIKNKKEHPNCLANYEGSSGGMEVAGVIKIFERSQNPPVPARYVHFLGDGDCKSFDAVSELKPYGDVTIDKLECINHVEKRMGTRLRELRKLHTNKLLSDGKKLSGKGRLTDSVINNLQGYYGKAIRSSKTLEDMKHACWATYYHKASTDADPQHGLCPLGGDSWCRYNRAAAHGLPCPEHTNSIPTAVMAAVKPIYEDLCSPNLLRRCVHGNTQNCNEAFNNIIWSRIPKNNFVNATTLKIGVLDSVITYNEGALAKVKVLQELCGRAGGNSVVGLIKCDTKRVHEAERAFLEIQKRARKAKKSAKRRLDDKQDEDGPSYGAGMF